MTINQLTIVRLDGTEVTVTPNLGDTLNFETTLRKNPQWGDLKANALKMQPFRAWSAGRREGTITETWEEFTASVHEVNFTENTVDENPDHVEDLGLDTPTAAPYI